MATSSFRPPALRLRMAGTSSGRTSRAFWRPHFGFAKVTVLPLRTEGVTTLDGVQINVPGGKGFTLWIDRHSGLLTRIDGSITKHFSDYRQANGILLPFTETQPQGAGELVVHFTTRTPQPRLDHAAFAVPFHSDYHMPASGVVTIPAEHGLLFEATLNGHAPLKTVFDTGAVNVMSVDLAHQLGLSLETQGIEFGTSTSATTQVHKTHVDTVQIGDLVLHNQTFYVINMPAEAGAPSLLMGYELLRRFGVRIDYQRQALTFYDGAHFRYTGSGTALPLHYKGNGLLVDGSVGTATGSFLLDTGNESGFSLSTGFVTKHNLVQQLGAHFIGYNGRGFAGPSPPAYIARLRTLKLGSVLAPPIVAHLLTDPSDTSNLAGNVGQSVLDKFTEVFDCIHGQVFFETTTRSTAPEIFNGAGLIFESFGHGLEIMTVLPDSPAARAGLQPGDTVTTINGKTPTDDTNQPDFLKPAGTTLHLTLHHGNQTRTVDLSLTTML